MIDILTTSPKIRSLLFFNCASFAKVSPKFRELCMETPCLCPSEGHKYGGRKVTEHLSLSCAIQTKNYSSRDPIH